MMEKMSFLERVITEMVNNGICSVKESKNIITTFEESSQEQFDMFLLEEELIEKGPLLKILSKVYKTPVFDVKGYFFDHELLLLFPKNFLMKNFFIPLSVEDETLTIVMSNPEDADTLERISNYVPYNVDVQVALSGNILEAIEEYYDLDIVSDSLEGIDDDEMDDDLGYGMEEIDPLDL